MADVFISYKSNDPQLGNNDETVAKELCAALEAAGISCWIAPRDIEPGVRYGRAIMEAINSCKVMVVVFSKHANTSEHIANEVDAIFARKVDIIPFNIDGSQPGLELNYYLRRMQWIDASGDYCKKIPELITALRHKLGKRDSIPSSSEKEPLPSQTEPVAYNPSIETFTVNGVSFNMVRVEGSTFMMGASPEQNEATDRERPAHKVTLSTFQIGETQVTQKLWEAVMGYRSKPGVLYPWWDDSKNTHDVNCPVIASWGECLDFIAHLNEITGRSFRFPTEAEWEFAARGGIKGKGCKYSGSYNLDEVAWFEGNSMDITHAVAKKKGNELGLYDMSGNVFEWCQDKYDLYCEENQTNPLVDVGPHSILPRVIRGGSYNGNSYQCCVSSRMKAGCGSDYIVFNVGLRLAL